MKITKVLKTLTTTAIISGLLMSCTYKSVDYSTRTVSVHGTGEVEVQADNATITMSVVTRGNNAAVASNENASIMTEVQKSVLSLGVSKDSVTTENFSIYRESNYKDGKYIAGDYVVTNQIKIFIKNIDIVSEVIDTAIGAGANELSNLEYGISEKEVAIKQARTLAVQQAQESAQLIAGTSGSKLGKVLRIEENANSSNRRNVMMFKSAADNVKYETASTPISAGKSTITVSVDAIYQLK